MPPTSYLSAVIKHSINFSTFAFTKEITLHSRAEALSVAVSLCIRVRAELDSILAVTLAILIQVPCISSVPPGKC